ncbi:MAG: hypothetical protein ACYC1Q_07665 [Bacteroidia bacterium]
MKTITLNFTPNNRQGEPHGIDYSCARFLQEKLDARITKARPALEASIANQLAANGTFEVSDVPAAEGEHSDFVYIRSIVEQLDVDNLLKGQILAAFV